MINTNKNINTKNIAIFSVTAIGDSVFSLMLVNILRKLFLHTSITYITDPAIGKLFERANGIDQIFPLTLAELNSQDPEYLAKKISETFPSKTCDLFLDLKPSRQSREIRKFFVNSEIHECRKNLFKKNLHAWQNYVYLYNSKINLADYSPKDFIPFFNIPENIYTEINFNKPVLAIIPGVGEVPKIKNFRDKSWKAQNWADLINILKKQINTPVYILLIADSSQKNLCSDIQSKLELNNINIINLCGKLDLVQCAGVLSKASLCIGADTGPVHLAASFGVETISLFGPTSPVTYAPFFGQIVSRVKTNGCSLPCKIKSRITKNCDCMDKISPEEVFQAIKSSYFNKFLKN